MRTSIRLTTLLFILFTAITHAQLTPQNAIKGMMRGINIGNTMEPPTEGAWGNPPVQQRAFDDYKSAGFTAVRIPITWDGHTDTTAPYAVNSAWMARVEQVVDWGLSRGLIIVINAHHETWLKTSFTPAHIARFDSIWSQIAAYFANRSDSLIFEIINEPDPLSQKNVDSLNAMVLKIIRRTNPTRIVSFSGYMWSNSDQLVIAALPDSSDKHLIGYYHSYDPYPFGLIGTGTYGNFADLLATKAKFDQVTTWSTKNNIPVMLGEFGYIDTADYNSRMLAYGTVVDQALEHGVAAFAWDDGEAFPVYDRNTGGFNEVKDILIHVSAQSPNGLKISQGTGEAIKLSWTNRNPESDSIVVERRSGITDFVRIATLPFGTSLFTDSTTSGGTSYYYRLSVTKSDATELQSYPITFTPAVTLVNPGRTLALRFGLSNNYPNPFNPSTVISYQLAVNSKVVLKVYDLLGREVATLVDEQEQPGEYSVTFDARGLASGMYYYRIQAGTFVETKKMLLLK
jgi:hypothetical protein